MTSLIEPGPASNEAPSLLPYFENNPALNRIFTAILKAESHPDYAKVVAAANFHRRFEKG